MSKLLKVGRFSKGGNLKAAVEIQGDTLEVELDPKLFAEPVITALRNETVKRIGAISVAPSPATVEKRGPGKLFNVSGYLRSGIYKEYLESAGHWTIVLPPGRELPRPVMNRLRAVAKLSLQSLLRAPAVRKALEQDMMRAIVKVNGPYVKKSRKK